MEQFHHQIRGQYKLHQDLKLPLEIVKVDQYGHTIKASEACSSNPFVKDDLNV